MGGAAGVAFVISHGRGWGGQGDVPVYTDGPIVIKEWFAHNSDRYLVGSCLIVLGVFFYLAFLAALVAALLRADEEHGPWPWLALLAGVHLVVAAQASVAFDPTLALLEGDVSDDVARTLSAADYMTFLLLYPFAGVLTLAVSLHPEDRRALATAGLVRPVCHAGWSRRRHRGRLSMMLRNPHDRPTSPSWRSSPGPPAFQCR
jgi:hypothetical protein